MRLIFFLSVFVLFSAAPFVRADVVKSVQPLDVQINLSSSRPLRKQVFGIHGALLWSPIRYEHALLADIYQDLGFSNIRFPGGTDANYYLWRTATYGCRRLVPEGSKSQERIDAFNRTLVRRHRTYTTNDFLSFIKETGTRFSLVVNVLCDSPEETRLWLEKIREDGVDVQHVEMGNELYYEEYAWAFPSAAEYIRDSRKHADEVKRVFPDAKIGIITSSSAYRSKEFPDFNAMERHERHRRGRDFDTSAAAASFAEAVVIHLYSTIGVSKIGSLRESSDYKAFYVNALSHFDGRVESSLHYVRKLNPSKEIWVTEWGVAFYGRLRAYEDGFLSTHYNALFVANGLLTFALSPHVNSANYHNFPNLWDGVDPELKRNPTYEIFRVMKEPMEESEAVSPVRIVGGNTYANTRPDFGGKESPELISAFFHNDGKGYLVIVNKLGGHYSIRSMSADSGADIQVADIVQMRPSTQMSGGALPAMAVIERYPVREHGVIDVPPYSVTRVLIRLKP